MIRNFFAKMRGGKQSPPRVAAREMVWAAIGTCLAIACLSWLENAFQQRWNLPLLMTSFGASCVLIFGAIQSPLAQPRNLVGGHILSALVGVTCFKLLGENLVLASCVTVAGAIVLMHLTKTLHPPGGATALACVIGGPAITQMGYWYVLIPCGAGAFILLAIAVIINNISDRRRYPLYWW